jgi:hypothetical protein
LSSSSRQAESAPPPPPPLFDLSTLRLIETPWLASGTVVPWPSRARPNTLYVASDVMHALRAPLQSPKQTDRRFGSF